MAKNTDLGRKRVVTLSEIARVAQVSKSTVSLVLNGRQNDIRISETTTNRVLDAAKRLGYRPNAAAKALATGRSDTILMVSFDLWDENLVERLRGAEAYFVPRGYSIRMCTVDATGGLSSYSDTLRTGQADGVLLTGVATRDAYPILQDLRSKADAAGVPVVAVADAFPRDLVQNVAHIDDESGSKDAVSHLIEHGHKRILFLGVDGQYWSERRQNGYTAALVAAGITIDPALIVLGDRSQTWAYEATLKLVESIDFTAMFVVTDNMALAAMSALTESGKKIPDDCAIIGFDNNEKMARFTCPPLTTVNNPFYDAGKAAAEMLVDLIDKRPVRPVLLPVSLVKRRSCGCNSHPLP